MYEGDEIIMEKAKDLGHKILNMYHSRKYTQSEIATELTNDKELGLKKSLTDSDVSQVTQRFGGYYRTTQRLEYNPILFKNDFEFLTKYFR